MAASLNKVFLLGNLTRDPELRYTPGGSAVCEFGIAVNRRFVSNNQERDETCFVEIVVWGKPAETCSRFLTKGSQVFIEGRLQYDQWEDRDSGTKRSRLRVVAEQVQFLGGRRGEDGGTAGDYGAGQPPQQPQQYSGGGGNYRQGGGNGPGGYYQAPPRQNEAPRYNQGGAPAGPGGMPPLPDDAFNVGNDVDDDIPF